MRMHKYILAGLWLWSLQLLLPICAERVPVLLQGGMELAECGPNAASYVSYSITVQNGSLGGVHVMPKYDYTDTADAVRRNPQVPPYPPRRYDMDSSCTPQKGVPLLKCTTGDRQAKRMPKFREAYCIVVNNTHTNASLMAVLDFTFSESPNITYLPDSAKAASAPKSATSKSAAPRHVASDSHLSILTFVIGTLLWLI